MKRLLIDGSEIEEFEHPIDLIIHTKVPGKWKIKDMETGEEYVGDATPHTTFAEILRQKVSFGKIGQWKKIKGKNKNEG